MSAVHSSTERPPAGGAGCGLPLSVALVGATPLVGNGLRAVLGSEGHGVIPVAALEELPVTADVVVVDTVSLGERATAYVEALVSAGHEPVVGLGLTDDPGVRRRLRRAGAHDYLPLCLSGPELVRALEDAVVARRQAKDGTTRRTAWLAACERVELSAREAEVLDLIAQGLSNKEVASELFLGINTIKTHVRNAYAKIGATSRSKAVLWAVAHGA